MPVKYKDLNWVSDFLTLKILGPHFLLNYQVNANLVAMLVARLARRSILRVNDLIMYTTIRVKLDNRWQHNFTTNMDLIQ